MKVIPTEIPDVVLLEPTVYEDERGFFYESYNKRELEKTIGLRLEFVQDNHSRSARNVLRGLHYQIRQPQGKLVRVTAGEIWDVGVDLRKSSATFGKWVGFNLSAASRRIAWIPPGFAHGFLVVSDSADVQYKTTDYYAPDHERTVVWSDSHLAIPWPLDGMPVIAVKDAGGKQFKDAEVFP